MTIEEIIGHTFRDKRLLTEALTHPSCAESKDGVAFNYQRLEFLGDAVLGVAVAELLFRMYPAENEGSLAKRQAALVCSDSIAEVGRKLGISQYMRVAASEQASRDSNSNLEDVCEALIGAIYMDGGFDAAREFILTHWQQLAKGMSQPPKDAKTSLQEWAQGRGFKLPHYRVLETVGPAHAPEFTIEVSVEGKKNASAKASSKRQAEQLAARSLLDILTSEE